MLSPAITEALTAAAVTKRFGGLVAVDNISFKLAEREVLGLIGPNGSGKTTMMNLISGALKPTSGEISVYGEAVTGRGASKVARKGIARTFQLVRMLPTMTALENVAVPLELAGSDDAHARAKAELGAVGLGARLGHYPAELSGGEQQRVALARALVANPAILVADEPTGNLDETTGREVIDLMFARFSERDMTLVLVTHDTSLAARCDRVIRLRSGQIAEAAVA